VAPGPNDLFIVGDPYQKIFPRRLVLKEAGVELAERSELLTLNYRTTSQIRDWAVAMLASHVTDDLDGGEATLAGYHSVRSGPVPEVRDFGTLEEETAQIVAHVKQLLEAGEEPESICVSARQRDRLPHYRDALRAAGLPAKILEPYTGDDEPGVVVATMYRIKGLEFKHMAIASVNEGELPPLTEDEPLEPALLRQTQRLLSTTAARARDSLLVTAFGTPSPLLKQESHAPSDPHALAPS
ncbi:MAG: 3'-5' exonuclease, partial [Candidatus Sericytochromatia bacterium]